RLPSFLELWTSNIIDCESPCDELTAKKDGALRPLWQIQQIWGRQYGKTGEHAVRRKSVYIQADGAPPARSTTARLPRSLRPANFRPGTCTARNHFGGSAQRL